MANSGVVEALHSLADIEAHTNAYAQARAVLAERVQALQDEMEQAKRRKLPGIRTALATAAAARDTLAAALRESPELFERPRTHVFRGVRVGYRKGKGGIICDNPDQVVALIKRHLPRQAETLIKTTRRPVRAALEQLDVGDLKRIGCRVLDTGDEIVIKATDSELDKLVDALFVDAADPDRDQEAA